MKRVFIFVALIALCLMAEAQWRRVPVLKKPQAEKKQQKSKSSNVNKDTVALQPVKVKEEDSQKDGQHQPATPAQERSMVSLLWCEVQASHLAMRWRMLLS